MRLDIFVGTVTLAVFVAGFVVVVGSVGMLILRVVIVGAGVVGMSVVGMSVVGMSVVGMSVVGMSVVGMSVVGVGVVGVGVVSVTVVGVVIVGKVWDMDLGLAAQRAGSRQPNDVLRDLNESLGVLEEGALLVVLRRVFESDDGVEGTLELDDDPGAFLGQLQNGTAVLVGAVGLGRGGTRADNEYDGADACAKFHGLPPCDDLKYRFNRQRSANERRTARSVSFRKPVRNHPDSAPDMDNRVRGTHRRYGPYRRDGTIQTLGV